jgi:HSP20 family protein
VRESDDAVVVTVEIPGFARDDLDLVVAPDGLTIRGETREEKADTRDDYRVVRSRYGRFVRTAAAARTRPRPGGGPRQGRVLTVKFPKVDARPGMRRVPIKP